jgi:hypothetical protein
MCKKEDRVTLETRIEAKKVYITRLYNMVCLL